MAKNNTRKRGLGSPNMDPKVAERIHRMGGQTSRGGGRKKRSEES